MFGKKTSERKPKGIKAALTANETENETPPSALPTMKSGIGERSAAIKDAIVAKNGTGKFSWSVISCQFADLQGKLNALDADGWEIFDVNVAPSMALVIARRPK